MALPRSPGWAAEHRALKVLRMRSNKYATPTPDAWTQTVLDSVKRMAIDANHRKQVMAFRAPDVAVAAQELFR